MILFTLRDAELAFGDQPLLDGAQLSLQEGERVGLIGRNGTGKSTLLKVIARRVALDQGEAQWRDGLRMAYVEQEPVLPQGPTVRESLLAQLGAGAAGAAEDPHSRMQLEVRIAQLAQRLKLATEGSPERASGGERRRAALVGALACDPQLLLLDEPTNHLDIEGITALEALLLRGPAALIITHDREFLDRVTTRIVELDRGVLRSYDGNFARYGLRPSQFAAWKARRVGVPASTASGRK